MFSLSFFSLVSSVVDYKILVCYLIWLFLIISISFSEIIIAAHSC